MEGQQHMPGGEPPKVKAPRKPKTRDLSAEGSHSGHAVLKSKQPEVANWDGYAAADPNQAYDYGEHAQGHVYGGQGYGYRDGTHGWDPNQGHEHTPGDEYGYGIGAHGYEAQVDEYGQPLQICYGAPGYEAPPAPKEKRKKPKKPKTPAAEGSYGNQQPVQGGSYENQPPVDEYGQPLQDGYGAPGYEAPPGAEEKPKKPKKPKKPAAQGSFGNQQPVQGGSYENQPQVDEYGAPGYEAPPGAEEKPKKPKKPKKPAAEGSYGSQQPVQGGSYENQPQVDEYGAPGYEAPPGAEEKPKKPKKPKKPAAEGSYGNQQPVQGGSYETQPQVDEYGQPLQDGYGAPGYEAPPGAEEKPRKPKKSKTPAAEGSYGNQQPVQGGSYENQPQVDEYGQPLHDVCGASASTKPHKSRKSSKDKSLERASHSDGAYVDPSNGAYGGPGNGAYAADGHGDGAYVDPSIRAYAAKYGNGAHVDPGYAAHHGDGVNCDNAIAMVPYNPNGRNKNKDSTSSPVPDAAGCTLSSRALSRVHGEHDNDPGSARSRLSQEGSQGAAPARAKSSDREGSGSNRAKPHRENEIRSSREGSGTPRLHPSSLRTVEIEGRSSIPAPNALNEHLRKTSKPIQHDSLVVFNDPSDRTLVDAKGSGSAHSALNEFMKQQPTWNQQESLIVQPDDNKDALETQLFGKKLTITLPPVETTERPQFQAVADYPLYQPVKRRPSHPITRHHQEVAQVDQNLPIVVKNNHEPNAKCMACVHGVGVPITRILTRIACKQCLRLACGGCTIL